MQQPSLDRDRLERLIAAGRSMLSELDLDAVLDRLLETARELTGARYAGLGILDRDRRELAQFLTSGIDERTQRTIGRLPRGAGVLGVLIDDPRPIRLADLSDHPRSSGFPPGHPPMCGFLGVPILVRGRPWGNLYLAEKHGGAFDQHDEDAVVVLADWAAIAVENARLYRRVEAAVRGFDASAAIARAVGGERELDRILKLIVERGRSLVEARAVFILLREGDELVVAAEAGDLGIEEGLQLPVAGSTPGDVLTRGEALRVTDVEHQLRIPPAALGVPDAATALLVPLGYRGTALGVLVAFDRLTGGVRFTSDDEEILEAFAASAATAVATAKTVEAVRLRRSIEGAESERRRWARELHDETLQGLGGLRVLLSSAVRLDDGEARSELLHKAIEHVDREIENLHAIITDLRPAALDQLGLVPALRSLARRAASVRSLDIVTHFALRDEDIRLPPEVETTAYRLVQEALANATKHARASRVEIEVRDEPGTIVVRVADDGTGFDTSASSAGFGLVGMRERVELAGGELRIESGLRGTDVSARIPLPDVVQPASRSPRSSA
jgi:two-component system, NarL family, sensor histidine kinase DevS